jgi:hypothetical protein
MTDKAWIDCFDKNKASYPANWDPSGTPQSGDTLLLPGGSTIDIVNGTATISANESGLTVNLADHASLIGNFEGQAALARSGCKGPKFINNGTITLQGTHDVIDLDVVGKGTFVVETWGTPASRSPGFLEFRHSVSAGQTVDVSGSSTSPMFGGQSTVSTVKIDHPAAFHGTVDLNFLSLADLVGLAQADLWSYKDDMLSISNRCGRVIDTLRVINDDVTAPGGAQGLSVSLSATGDVMVTPGGSFHGYLAAPMT